MPSSRVGPIALLAAAVLWAQLALLPLLAEASRGGAGVPGLVAAGGALAVLVATPIVARRRPPVAVALLLAGFPLALGAFALVTGPRGLARFDVPARLVAAVTAAGFFAAAIAWAQSLVPRAPATVAPTEPLLARTPPPPLRRTALGAVGLVATALAVVAPAVLSARAPATRAERLGGDALARAREAMTAAGGLALALAVVLVAGSALVRGRSGRERSVTRGVAYVIWGSAVAGLLLLLERAR